jgi:hypothetical protein
MHHATKTDEEYIHTFLNSAQGRNEQCASRSGVIYPVNSKLGGLQSRSGLPEL